MIQRRIKMAKYLETFKESWNDLCGMYNSGKFTPHQEQDVVCMMYHLCLRRLRSPKLIHTSSGWNFDLVLGEIKGEKKSEMNFSHCLLAEFKFVLKKGRKKKSLDEAERDIKRLSKTGDASVRRVFAIFEKEKWLRRNEISGLKRIANNVTVLSGPS
jgi:hypothetical protein